MDIPSLARSLAWPLLVSGMLLAQTAKPVRVDDGPLVCLQDDTTLASGPGTTLSLA